MKQYLKLLETILEEGLLQENRTGVKTLRIPTAMLTFNMGEGFPLVTTRKMPIVNITGELFGFIRAYDSAADFRKLGCMFWDQNANENEQWLANPLRRGTDDLGPIYGVMWRKWPCSDGTTIDQFENVLNTLKTNPQDRRMVVNAWNPELVNAVALPSCHYRFRLMADTNSDNLTMIVNMRSTIERLH